jgi:transcription antitermination factor NusG
MPILPAEPALFPEALFDLPPPPETGGRHWWALHTRPRQEKSLARALSQRRIPFYLPLAGRRLRIRGQVVTSHLPLFPGYVFLLGAPEERVAALATRRVVRALAVADQQGLWQDLRQVERLLASGKPVQREDQLGPGAPVEIRGGPLDGLRGVVVKAVSGCRFIVRVDFIQRGASVLLDDADLVPLTARPPQG